MSTTGHEFNMRTRNSRLHIISDVLENHAIHAQGELLALLEERGIKITQATLSRDLSELGAVKVRQGRSLVYALPGLGGDLTPRPALKAEEMDIRIRKACHNLLVSAIPASNLAVLRTPPGAAQYLASTLDHAPHLGVIGTVAGDDTVILVCRSADEATSLAERLLDCED